MREVKNSLVIRNAKEDDVSTLLVLIKEISIKFYKSLGAVPMDEWIVYRLTDDKINELAEN